MIKHAQELPVTYLNKCQAYLISIYDTTPPDTLELVQYTSTFRICFHDIEQRQHYATCWRLWRDARGNIDAEGDPRRLKAIELGI